MKLQLKQLRYSEEMKQGVEWPLVFEVVDWPRQEYITIESVHRAGDEKLVNPQWVIKRDGISDPDRYETKEAAKEKLEAEI